MYSSIKWEALSALRKDVQVGNVSHGWPSVGTVPGVVHLAHVGNEFFHLACAKGSSNHHLKRRHSDLKLYWFWLE